MNASARTVNGLPLAMPRRTQASGGRFWKNDSVDPRTAWNSSMRLFYERASLPADATATS